MKLVKFKEDNLVLGIGILDIDDVSENQYKKWEKQISENRKKRVDCYKKA